MNNKEVLEKEIDLIQSCINRMSQSSFMVKGWIISLVTITLALLPETINVDIKMLCIPIFLATLCFWYLNAFFLKIEKLYRWKYEWVINNRQNTLDYAYDLNSHNSKMWIEHTKEPKIICVMWSPTIWPIYTLIILITLFVFLNSFFNWI